MTFKQFIQTTNTILYSKNWRHTVIFYRDYFMLPVLFSNEWFFEFELTETSRLSIANEKKATIKSSKGAGITLTFQVEDVHAARQFFLDKGLTPGSIKAHAWGARVFYLWDPEGNRIEVWSAA